MGSYINVSHVIFLTSLKALRFNFEMQNAESLSTSSNPAFLFLISKIRFLSDDKFLRGGARGGVHTDEVRSRGIGIHSQTGL